MDIDCCHNVNVDIPWPINNYIELVSYRGLCRPLYRFVFDLAGSLRNAQVYYLLVLYLSVAVHYLFFRRLVSESASLAASLLLLVYSSKYQTLTNFGVGCYNIMLLASGIMLWISALRISHWIKSALIAMVLWPSLHVYEHPLLLTPLFALLILFNTKSQARPISFARVAASSVPMLVAAAHILALSMGSAERKLWHLYTYDESTTIPLLDRILLGTLNGMNSSFGPRHFHLLKYNVKLFLQHVIFDRPILLAILAILSVACLAWVYRFSYRQRINPRPVAEESVHCVLFGVSGLYIALAGNLLSFLTSVVHPTPSRMTVIPCIGVAMCVGCLVEACRFVATQAENQDAWQVRFHAAIRVLASLSAVAAIQIEAVAFSGIVWQHHVTESFDQKIMAQVKRIAPNLRVESSRVVVILPRQNNSDTRFCRQEWSHLYDRPEGLFWWHYRFVHSRRLMDYRCIVRDGSDSPEFVPRAVKACDGADLNDLFVFYIDGTGVVTGIARLRTVDTVATLEFPAIRAAEGVRIGAISFANGLESIPDEHAIRVARHSEMNVDNK